MPLPEPGATGHLGSYRIVKELGRGGMGIVYQAEDIRLKRLVALKALLPSVAADADAGQRFLREAQAMAAVRHEHIATIFQVDEADGVPFLAMELLHGESLSERLEREHKLPTAEALRIGREIAEGLAAAHATGLIHRDIKPGNIWLESPRGRVKILDFGLARPAGHDTHITQPGGIVGTPSYMAPEQARGEVVDARCDLFSLGILLYRMLTGRQPFHGNDPLSTLLEIVLHEPPAPSQVEPSVPLPVAELVMRLLEKNPDRRPASASEVAEALHVLQTPMSLPRASSEATHVLPRTKATPGGVEHDLTISTAVSRPRRRIPYWRLVGAALVIFGVAAVFYGGALVRVITNRGQLVVEVDDPDVEIVVKQGGATVVDHQKDRQYELTAAEGDVDLYEAASGVRLVTKHFRLERGGRTVVDARMDVAAAKAAPKPASTATAAVRHADREKPFVVVGKNGSRREYKHCTAALAVLQPGDSVEVLGNGPFKLPAIRLDGRSLTLRAGSGYRPVFVPAADVTGPWITVHNAPLRLVGCDFHRYAGPALQGSGRWKIDGCRLVSALYGEGAVIEFHGPKLTVQNCLMTQMIACDDCVQVELVNNLIHSAVQILSLSNGGGQTIHLQGNTVLTEREVIRLHADAATRPVQIRAEGNLWCGPRLVWASDNVTASNFHWQGRDNLYVAMSSFVGNELGVRVKDLKEWARFCGLSELGSQAVADVRFGWDEVAAKGLDGGLPLLRQRIAMIKQRHGLAELGPHWEWIGPGEAYVRALTAAHDPRAQAPQRPEPPETGPVVLIRGDKMVRGYTDLQQAFNAAGDGDVVELGTDGPLAGASIAGQRKLALTIRAAPGYRPVVEGDLVFQSAVRVSIEGLDFRKGTVDYRYGYGRLVRLANCAFDTQDARHLVGMMIDDQGERPTEVVNCWLPGVWAFRPSLKHIAIIRNSVVGPCAEMSRRSDGAVGIRVEQCVLWNPGLGRPPEPDSAGAVRRHPEPRLDMDVHRSLVEAGYLANTWDNFSWKGIQTAYCTDDDNLLAHLTTQGSREDGSVVDAPLEWDPAQWRLLPGQPKRSDGHDYGAEVRRVLD